MFWPALTASGDIDGRFTQWSGQTEYPRDAAGGRLRLERALKLHTPRLPATPERVNPSGKFVETFWSCMAIP